MPSAQEDWSYSSYTNGVEFRHGKSFLQLSQKGDVYEGKIVIQPSAYAAMNRRTKLEFELILMNGYPPWFKETVTNTASITFSFPRLLDGNLKRSGWIVAVGLGDIDDPLPYFSTRFGNFREPEGNHRGGGKGVYWLACKHLQDAVGDGFGKRFPKDTVVQAARRAIDAMMEEHSAEKVGDLLRDSPLENADMPGKLTGQLDKADIELAIDIFNDWPKFDDAQLERLRPILVAVLAGAVRGLARMFQHLNVHSFQVHGRFEGILQMNPAVYVPGP
ncbi:hypothetical protein TARUN_688 [Trichoderma arundinaceum]|uniref:Uncharacterized protein n=1 Tax=Trichoderma arundinaceum TaxID=490622 RepID=A0A395NZP9_TRIAR|nr:hypothetical protein TARUN_688 [Trichoderma arundinaceum]